MKTLFILGAGASRQAGGPLMSDFLDRAEEIYSVQRKAISGAEAAFEDVFSAISELRTVHFKSFLDLDNIEVLFGAIEMAQTLGKLANRKPESIEKLRESMITLVFKTLECAIEFPVEKGHIGSPPPYGVFAASIRDLTRSDRPPHLRPELAFLTFNYDLALDVSLSSHEIPYDYWLPSQARSGKCPYLKLHGSVNWGTCRKCEAIVPRDVTAVTRILHLPDRVYLPLGSRLGEESHCDQPLSGPPVLIPPTWDKAQRHRQIASVWRKAAEELASAQNIFVIGYSLPETDSFFRYLFALGADSPTRIKRFWVFNPDEDGTVEVRFRKLVGRALENRFQFHRSTFQQAIPTIVGALGQS